jgi:hypothetical protein
LRAETGEEGDGQDAVDDGDAAFGLQDGVIEAVSVRGVQVTRDS